MSRDQMIAQGGTGDPKRGARPRAGPKVVSCEWQLSGWEIPKCRVALEGTERPPPLSVLLPRSYFALLATITLAWWMNLAESSCREITDTGSWEQGTKWTEGNPHR